MLLKLCPIHLNSEQMLLFCFVSGGLRIKGVFRDGKFPPDYYDGENCYACAERIKHPPGAAYRAGHDVLGYGVGEEESLVE